MSDLTLQEHASRARLSVEEILDVGLHVSSALAALHEQGRVHGNIGVDGIRIAREPAIRVTDVGPAHAGGSLDVRSDIRALGAVLYTLAAGRPPLDGSTSSESNSSMASTEPVALSRYAPDVHPELERILRKALRTDPEQRYQTIKALEIDLRALRERPSHEDRPAAAAPPPATGGGRRRGAAMMVMGALAVAGIAAAYALWGRSAAARPAITSLAVVPFQNQSNDPGTDYLSDGITESLINQLSQLPGLKVIAHSSSSRYQGQKANPQDVAKALNATGIIAGKIAQRGNDLSVSVELIDGRDSTLVWGEQYLRRAADLQQVQADISRQVADTLKLHLTANQSQRIAERSKVDPAAYELLLKGRFHRAKGSTDDRRKATDYFTQAIALAPNYAAAYAELSDHYRGLVNSSLLDPAEYLPRAEQAALKALELDNGLAEAHYALANLKTQAWQWAAADQGYQRAIELNPNLALAHRWYASYLRLMGRHDTAIAEVERARALDPLSPVMNATVGYILLNARQYDRAIGELQKTIELDRNYSYPHVLLGYTYAAQGRHGQAITAYQEAIKRGRATPSTEIFLATSYARAGDRERATEILTRLQAGRAYVSPGELAVLHEALGKRDEAFASLEQAYAVHDPQLQYLGVSPAFDTLRPDPRFSDLLRRIGLPTPKSSP
jgi:TolB-like protein/Tfp pilus assembly protein PilF